MTDLNLNILKNDYLCGLSQYIIDRTKISEIESLGQSDQMQALIKAHKKFTGSLNLLTKNQYTEALQLADNMQVQCYKALYYAVKSHLFFPSEEQNRYAQSLIELFKMSPRYLERTSQHRRNIALLEFMSVMQNNAYPLECIHSLGIDAWLIALSEAHQQYNSMVLKRITESAKKKTKGTLTKHRPQLIDAIKEFYRFVESYCHIHPEEKWLTLKADIESEYKESRTIHKRNATRRKNKRAKAVEEISAEN